MKVDQKKQVRSSNIELYRIIAMLLIVAHHYVVNSGMAVYGGVMYSDPLSWRSVFLFLLGAWGKTGINCFIMITGYYMCRSQITAHKFVKLLGEILFYKITVYLVFLLSGYEAFSVRSLVLSVLPVTSINDDFLSCYLIFFLLIPFINVLIHHISQRQHLILLLLCSFVYILLGTVHRVTMNYVTWFIVLYLIASYIRIYPKKCYTNQKLWGTLSLSLILLAAVSVAVCLWVGARTGRSNAYYFVVDSNTFLAVTIGISSFLFFHNLKIRYNRIINAIAASAFGVLLIHANSDTMRNWLWRDTLDNLGHYNDTLMPLYAIGCILAVYLICSVIDYFRIRFLEEPFLAWWDRNWEHWCNRFIKA